MSVPALSARSWGQGPPVVLLHGLGASSRYWETLAHSSSGYAATAPDLLGFGRSPKPPEASYDAACHVEALSPTQGSRWGAPSLPSPTGEGTALLRSALAGGRLRRRRLILTELHGGALSPHARVRHELGARICPLGRHADGG